MFVKKNQRVKLTNQKYKAEFSTWSHNYGCIPVISNRPTYTQSHQNSYYGQVYTSYCPWVGEIHVFRNHRLATIPHVVGQGIYRTVLAPGVVFNILIFWAITAVPTAFSFIKQNLCLTFLACGAADRQWKVYVIGLVSQQSFVDYQRRWTTSLICKKRKLLYFVTFIQRRIRKP